MEKDTSVKERDDYNVVMCSLCEMELFASDAVYSLSWPGKPLCEACKMHAETGQYERRTVEQGSNENHSPIIACSSYRETYRDEGEKFRVNCIKANEKIKEIINAKTNGGYSDVREYITRWLKLIYNCNVVISNIEMGCQTTSSLSNQEVLRRLREMLPEIFKLRNNIDLPGAGNSRRLERYHKYQLRRKSNLSATR